MNRWVLLIPVVGYSYALRSNSSSALSLLIVALIISIPLIFSWIRGLERDLIQKLERIIERKSPETVGDAIRTRSGVPVWLIGAASTLLTSTLFYALLISSRTVSKTTCLLYYVILGFLCAYAALSFYSAHVIGVSEGAALRILRALAGDECPEGPGVWKESAHLIG